ncbi:peptide-N4-(n-acetyl-beta-glucosaminyl)asparagine amidase A [Fusarium tjaetaba]|uniref:Peptide-N4-(N-acetyl-beta-glucosaminyl)asparagine amidase A n=1 Tax=Fusarium tjaetaba TaxID=1567544 RepID=A0A8H5QSS3_9HYPO|nr:peptide-N4-(n-acetyl-beta-glucosaminyl)asparagine amidase A [Fusarium tjaetaba]KAF5620649.1 peptide-N4-(n-acetyl-beta-glucosaminyl)asparagine amidase A [Fusarium tjaetaba]
MTTTSHDSPQYSPYCLPSFRPVSFQRPQPQPQSLSLSLSQQEAPYLHYSNINNVTYDLDFFNVDNMAAATASHRRPHQDDSSVAQALEIARESPDGSSDPTISKILESALKRIWFKVEMQPDSYVMTRDEFAVFNFFQDRFINSVHTKKAVDARKRYWDNTHA